MSTIIDNILEPIQGVYNRAKQPFDNHYPFIIAILIAFISISLYYYTLRFIISSINANTDQLLKNIGLTNEIPKILHNNHLIASIDPTGNLINISSSTISLRDPETIVLKNSGIYLISYHITSPNILGAYFNLDGDRVAQTGPKNYDNRMTVSELIYSPDINELIHFNIIREHTEKVKSKISGNLKIIYFGNI